MGDEPYLLVSLDEEKSKSLAQVLSNDTARKILDHLSKKEHATETDISKDLKVPLSTVHYNLDLLVKADLVSNEQFTYSEKGKQIVHYALSNKYVIIAPKRTQQLMDKLKQFLPVLLITTGISLGIKYFMGSQPQPLMYAAAPMLQKSAADTSEALATGMRVAAETPITQTQEFAVWFLFGSVAALVIYFVWAEIILKKIKK
jgi:DNA-binding transcriptional ArsR family regulator